MTKTIHTDADVAIIGAGHAGIEAALAAARLGVSVILFTLSLDAVANMPCNPSVGGSGKGHLVYEIDALGGEMGYIADQVTLQARTLNLGKGAAVHAKRIQADRMAYRSLAKHILEKTENLRILQAEITDILYETKAGIPFEGETPPTEGLRVRGVRTHLGEIYRVGRVILATGTYPEATIFVGDVSYEGGPDGMRASHGLSASLVAGGISLMRFKTGTPARVLRHSLDLSVMERQEGDCDAIPFSRRTRKGVMKKINLPCHMVYTTEATHRIIRENLHRSALYGGMITGTGPRYCPSIEDKLVRFADKERHQLFVEPTGADSEEMYIQGFSTSMPPDVQLLMLRSLPGFQHAQVTRYAYAIEYDCIDPTQLRPTLELLPVEGLYGAGQCNGTSGYEEAAAQGLIAGINAALAVKGEPPLILRRSSSYIGTLIDDLVTKGTKEPYRMMTSRSEYRLLLRQDNADLRLTALGHRVGLIGSERYRRFLQRKTMIEEEILRMKRTVISPNEKNRAYLQGLGSACPETGITVAELLRRPELDDEALAPLDVDRPLLPPDVRFTAALEVKYEGYIRRQLAEISRRESMDELPLPPDLDYKAIRGLRLEAAEKLARSLPANVGQASRISGVNPADITVLLLYLKQKALPEH